MTRCMIGISTAAAPITASIHRAWVVISLRTSKIVVRAVRGIDECGDLLDPRLRGGGGRLGREPAK